MFTMVNENTRRLTSAVAATAVVAFAGLALDQGHIGALPEGTVEVGELVPTHIMQMARVTLPEVVVTGERIEHGVRQARATHSSLPGLAVAAGKAALEGTVQAGTDNAPKASVLLK